VDKNSRLDLFFDYRFKLEEGALKKTIALIGQFFKRIWSPSKNKETVEVKEERKKQIYFSF